jgi:hypothetical protein
MEIMQSMKSDYNEIKLETSNRKLIQKSLEYLEII